MSKNKIAEEVEIRKLRLSDAESLRKCINNKEVIKNLDDENIKYPFSLKDAKEYILKSLKNKDCHEFAILFNQIFVGTVVLENPNRNKRAYELGYFIAGEYQRKGIATEAVKKILKFGFEKLKIKRVWAGTLSNNTASSRVLEKVGFKLEGRLRKHTFKEGKYRDDLIYGLVK